jgi:hypothetical protein
MEETQLVDQKPKDTFEVTKLIDSQIKNIEMEQRKAVDTTASNPEVDNSKTCTKISQLGSFDVLCGRDKTSCSNSGNREFRVLINANLPRYLGCTSKFQRSMTIKSIADDIRGSIRFFTRVKGSRDAIVLLDEHQIHEKVAHALRDCAKHHRKRLARRQWRTLATTPPSASDELSCSSHHSVPDELPSLSHHRLRDRHTRTNNTVSVAHARLRELRERDALINSAIEASDEFSCSSHHHRNEHTKNNSNVSIPRAHHDRLRELREREAAINAEIEAIQQSQDSASSAEPSESSTDTPVNFEVSEGDDHDIDFEPLSADFDTNCSANLQRLLSISQKGHDEFFCGIKS